MTWHPSTREQFFDVRRIANAEALSQSASASVTAPIRRTIDEWSDPAAWGELRQQTHISFEYGGSAAKSFVVIQQSPDQAVYLGENEIIRTLRALSAALGAIRELDDQRYRCEVGECAHVRGECGRRIPPPRPGAGSGPKLVR
jgi:hypothetical protein